MTMPPYGEFPQYQNNQQPQPNHYPHQGAPQAPYSQYSSGPGAGFYDYADSNHDQLVNTNGQVHVLNAVKWSFQRWSENMNWLTWIWVPLVFVLIISIVFAAGAGVFVLVAESDVQWLAFIGFAVLLIGFIWCSFAYNAFMLKGSIRQLETRQIQFGDFTKNAHIGGLFGLGVLLLLILGLFAGLIGGLAYAIAPKHMTDDEIGLYIMCWSLVFILLAVLVSPFFFTMPYYVVDGRLGSSGAIGKGFADGKRHWGKIFLYLLLEGVLSQFFVMATLGLGAFAIGPIVQIVRANIYRQAAGGPIPAGSAMMPPAPAPAPTGWPQQY
ncbi:hypothetical protein QP027_06445 [Corynebacterium breve]|uniref:DUF975 family protein n=1 Tax=Corynebacterium breve TaxID=3049799 RepID=A0ABY8VAU2_9CORY|nr:hypothetical protein [Corynebacterium breve]WIM66776.1 hypothetical protein QP027_06445 [Corynebacterium breve]